MPGLSTVTGLIITGYFTVTSCWFSMVTGKVKQNSGVIFTGPSSSCARAATARTQEQKDSAGYHSRKS